MLSPRDTEAKAFNYITCVAVSKQIHCHMYTIQKTEHFSDWLHGLRDVKGKAKILARLKRAEQGNLGDHKSVGNGVAEMRVDSGPGYRVYFSHLGKIIIVILAGGDKSTQTRDIRRAKQIAGEIGA